MNKTLDSRNQEKLIICIQCQALALMRENSFYSSTQRIWAFYYHFNKKRVVCLHNNTILTTFHLQLKTASQVSYIHFLYLSRMSESNQQPADYKSAALPLSQCGKLVLY